MLFRGMLVFALLCSGQSVFAAGGLADLALYDRTTGALLPSHYHQGRHYVVGQPDNEYEIRIRNNTRADVLAVVSVDGINVITGQTASPSQSGYVVFAYGSTRISGWRKSLSAAASFYFTPLSDSYAARTHRPENVGVIGVALFQRHHFEEELGQVPGVTASPRAKQEAQSRAQDGAQDRAEPKLGTGHGQIHGSAARHAQFERSTSRPVEVITLYYDSHENLVARGILQSRPGEPDPFPLSFTPDPPVHPR